MSTKSRLILASSLLWSAATVASCLLVIAVSTWTMMHREEYAIIDRWVIWQMLLNLLVLPASCFFLRDKYFPARPRLYVFTKRIHIVVALAYLVTVFFETNRYAHFVELGKKPPSFGPYESRSGKRITPTSGFVDGPKKGPRVFFLQYDSELDPADTVALREEILFIWRQAKADADGQGAYFAAVRATTSPKSEDILNQGGMALLFRRDSLGTWLPMPKTSNRQGPTKEP